MEFVETVVGGALRAVLSWYGRSKLPNTQGVMRLAEIDAPVEILRDRWGIPHIYAQNRRDLVFAQGFVHAQDRL